MKTTNLELSKKLKEAGFPQESTYYYFKDAVDINEYMYSLGIRDGNLLRGVTYSYDNATGMNDYFPKYQNECYASPTADELLDFLPHMIETDKKYVLEMTKYVDGYGAGYHTFEDKIYSETLADTLAYLWLYLKENNLL